MSPLKKEISCIDCSSLILGIIIGTGIFSTFPTLVAKHNTSAVLIILTWLAGGIFAWFGAMCYAELASIYPFAGGDYTFLHKAYVNKGRNIVSFLYAWAKILVIRPSSIAVLALIMANSVQHILVSLYPSAFNASPDNIITLLISIIIVALLTAVNVSRINLSKVFQNSVTVLKVLILLFIISYGILKTNGNAPAAILPESAADKSLWEIIMGFWSAMVLTMWVYGGWNEAVYIAEETKNPSKDIPRALFSGIFLVTLMYIGINFIYIKFLSAEGLSSTFTPSSDIMSQWFGANGGMLMSGIIAVSALGAINGLIMTGGRLSYSIAREYSILSRFAILHPVNKTPGRALLGNLFLTLVLLFLSRGRLGFIENLTFYTAGVFWYFTALVIIGLIITRKKMKKENIPFKVPLFPLFPVLFLLITAGLIWGSIQFKPFETLAGMGILFAGMLSYYLFSMRKERRRL
jgi:amino acid transporter